MQCEPFVPQRSRVLTVRARRSMHFASPNAIRMTTGTRVHGMMGRASDMASSTPTLVHLPLHLVLAVLYTVLIAMVAKRFHTWRGIVAGGITGLILYALNLFAVRLCAQRHRGLRLLQQRPQHTRAAQRRNLRGHGLTHSSLAILGPGL